MNFLKNQPAWKRCGFIAALLYLSLTGLLLIGSASGVAGKGENDLFGWAMLLLMIPSSWLLHLLGVNLVISSSILLITLINAVVFFGVGSLIGHVARRMRNKA
ncbi:MAG: hypothetical protein M0Z67_04875 [Nitrospiraceae bacterium]|nr:hypothetical protein [Nitrospiraceae bacterium]